MLGRWLIFYSLSNDVQVGVGIARFHSRVGGGERRHVARENGTPSRTSTPGERELRTGGPEGLDGGRTRAYENARRKVTNVNRKTIAVEKNSTIDHATALHNGCSPTCSPPSGRSVVKSRWDVPTTAATSQFAPTVRPNGSNVSCSPAHTVRRVRDFKHVMSLKSDIRWRFVCPLPVYSPSPLNLGKLIIYQRT